MCGNQNLSTTQLLSSDESKDNLQTHTSTVAYKLCVIPVSRQRLRPVNIPGTNLSVNSDPIFKTVSVLLILWTDLMGIMAMERSVLLN